MEEFGFELVCAACLETRGVLDSEHLPEQCPSCGARDTWKGPYATPRFERDAEQMTESPFYLAASRAPAVGSVKGRAPRDVERQLG
jgi:hypothetical protein